MKDCLFCKIIHDEIPCYKLYEDDLVIAFLNINPDSNGHTLIIPKKHMRDLDSMDITTWNHLFEITKKMKERMEEILHIDGLTLMQNSGAHQEVKHFHLHLKPYYQKQQEIKPIQEIYDILKITQD